MTVAGWTGLIDGGLLDIERGDPIGLVVESGCRYAASLAFAQSVEIGLAVAKLGTSSVAYHLGAFAGGAESSEGHFTHVYEGRDNRRPIPLPAASRGILERLI